MYQYFVYHILMILVYKYVALSLKSAKVIEILLKVPANAYVIHTRDDKRSPIYFFVMSS